MAITVATARERLALIGRGAPRPMPPLFLPMYFTVSAQIEAVSPTELAANETKLVRAGKELARLTGQPAIFTAMTCGAVASALGATLEESNWPPNVTTAPDCVIGEIDASALVRGSPFLSAGLGATRNLAGEGINAPIPVAALEGPVALQRQLSGSPKVTEDRADSIGSVIAGLIGEFAEAGAGAIFLVDEPAPDDSIDQVKNIYRTLANMARFHRKPLVVIHQSPLGLPTVVPALEEAEKPAPMQKSHARLWPQDPASWPGREIDSSARIVTTACEVPSGTPLEQVFALGAEAAARFD